MTTDVQAATSLHTHVTALVQQGTTTLPARDLAWHVVCVLILLSLGREEGEVGGVALLVHSTGQLGEEDTVLEGSTVKSEERDDDKKRRQQERHRSACSIVSLKPCDATYL